MPYHPLGLGPWDARWISYSAANRAPERYLRTDALQSQLHLNLSDAQETTATRPLAEIT